MSRVIHVESHAKQRKLLSQTILSILPIQNLVDSQILKNTDYLDKIAFIALCVDEIAISIQATVTSWEKRGYWLKADKFNYEWQELSQLNQELNKHIRENKYHGVGEVLEKIRQFLLNHYQKPVRELKTSPWIGSMNKYINLKNRSK